MALSEAQGVTLTGITNTWSVWAKAASAPDIVRVLVRNDLDSAGNTVPVANRGTIPAGDSLVLKIPFAPPSDQEQRTNWTVTPRYGPSENGVQGEMKTGTPLEWIVLAEKSQTPPATRPRVTLEVNHESPLAIKKLGEEVTISWKVDNGISGKLL